MGFPILDPLRPEYLTKTFSQVWESYDSFKSDYDDLIALVSGGIQPLTADEIDSLMPHIHVGHNVVQKCIKFADQKEQQAKRKQRQERLQKAKNILNPLGYLAFLLAKRKNISKNNRHNNLKQQETR